MFKLNVSKSNVGKFFLQGLIFGIDNFSSILMLLMIFLIFKDFPVMVLRQFLKEINSPYVAIVPVIYTALVLSVLMPWVFYITFQRYKKEKIKFSVLFKQPRFMFSLIGASILYFLGISLGLFLIIPGIWVATRYFFYPHFLYCGHSIKSAFSESAKITTGIKTRLFLLFFLSFFIVIIISGSIMYFSNNIMIALAGVNFLGLLVSVWFEYIRTYMFCKLTETAPKKTVEKKQPQVNKKITSENIFSSIIAEAEKQKKIKK